MNSPNELHAGPPKYLWYHILGMTVVCFVIVTIGAGERTHSAFGETIQILWPFLFLYGLLLLGLRDVFVDLSDRQIRYRMPLYHAKEKSLERRAIGRVVLSPILGRWIEKITLFDHSGKQITVLYSWTLDRWPEIRSWFLSRFTPPER